MREGVFLDSAYLIALEDDRDQSHEAASRHWRGLTGAMPRIVTTTFVLTETVTFFKTRGRHQKAVDLGHLLMSSSWIQLVHVDRSLLLETWDYLVRRADKACSLTDCVSFVLMARLGLRTALTFDHHFVQAGFEVQP